MRRLITLVVNKSAEVHKRRRKIIISLKEFRDVKNNRTT